MVPYQPNCYFASFPLSIVSSHCTNHIPLPKTLTIQQNSPILSLTKPATDQQPPLPIPILFSFPRKQEEVQPSTDILTPIDEDLEEGEEEDPDDTPITMGAHIKSRQGPTITHTAASPSDPPSPNEVSQRESVL